MKVEHIRAAIATRPFRPLEFELDSGRKFVLRHPELAFVRDSMIVVDLDGDILLFEPEAGRRRARRPRRPRHGASGGWPSS